MEQATRIPAEYLLELLLYLRDEFECLHLLMVSQILHLGERLGPHHRAHGERRLRIKDNARLIRREELRDVALFWHIHLFHRVGENEAIHAHHDGQRKLLGDLECLDVKIGRLLIILGVQLEPAGIALRHGIGVIVPNVNGAADRAVGYCHDNRKAQPGGVVHGLHHEEQTLRGGSRVCSRAGSGRSDARGHRRELRLHIDVFTVA